MHLGFLESKQEFRVISRQKANLVYIYIYEINLLIIYIYNGKVSLLQ